MTAPSRVIAVLAGLVGIILAAAELVRQAALAVGDGVVWPAPGGWSELTGDPSWRTTGLAAGATAVIAVALIILAARQIRRPQTGRALIEFAAEGGSARLSVLGLERALARRFEVVVRGARVASVGLTRGGEGWCVRVEAQMPAVELAGAQAHAFVAFAEVLERAGGLRLARLDLVVRDLQGPPR